MRESAFVTWRQMGLHIVLADGYSSGRYEHLANEFAALDPRDGSADMDEILELARDCDGVTTLADNSQLTAAAVAEDLGLAGIGRAAAAIARSKLLQRSLCERAGLPAPQWRQVSEPGDLSGFFADCRGPAVLKPVDCAGSAGVLRVRDEQDALRQWQVVRSVSRSRTVIIEEFVPGRELCVDAVVVASLPVFVSICDADYTGPEGFIAVSAKYAAIQPDRAAAVQAIQRVVHAFGLANGVMQAEFKVDRGRWVLLEATFRPGGALVPDLTERVTGVNLYLAQARIALGMAPPVPPSASARPVVPHAQVRFLVASGTVRRFVPPGSILGGLPDVKVVNQFAMPGQRVRLPLSEDGRAGYAVGWAADSDRLDAQLREAVSRLGREMGLTEQRSADAWRSAS
jgi:biotin carboxylase